MFLNSGKRASSTVATLHILLYVDRTNVYIPTPWLLHPVDMSEVCVDCLLDMGWYSVSRPEINFYETRFSLVLGTLVSLSSSLVICAPVSLFRYLCSHFSAVICAPVSPSLSFVICTPVSLFLSFVICAPVSLSLVMCSPVSLCGRREAID